MARVVKTAQDRRAEILDVSRRLFIERGFANTPIKAIIEEVGIAKGTFYHHFHSKMDLLDAMVDRLLDEARHIVQEVLDLPDLDAIARYHAFYRAMGAWKSDQRAFLLNLQRALDDDANVRVRVHLREAGGDVAATVLVPILEQGVREGVFDVTHPGPTARAVLAISQATSDSMTRLMLQRGTPPSLQPMLDLVAAHQLAIERVLDAPPGSLELISKDDLLPWFEAMKAGL